MVTRTERNPMLKMIITLAAIALVIAVGYAMMTAPDRRTPSEKLGDAVSELGNGVDKAAEQLEDRTPVEKMGDAIEDAGDDIQRKTNQ